MNLRPSFQGMKKIAMPIITASIVGCQNTPAPTLPGFSREDHIMFKRIESFRNQIFEYYNEDQLPSREELEKYLAQGVINSIDDPYADLTVKDKDIERKTQNREGSLYSPGFQMIWQGEHLYWTVGRVLEDSAIFDAGIQQGDILVSYGGLSLLTGNSSDADPIQKIIDEGKKVKAVFFRPSTKEEITVEYAPRKLTEQNIESYVRDGVGVIEYRDFLHGHHEKFAENVRKILNEGATSLVLDLRGNSGGSLTTMQHIATMFLAKGSRVYVSENTRTKKLTAVNTNVDPIVPLDMPMMILVDSASASASEILSLALQKNERALVAGNSHSFGKGVGQETIMMDFGQLEVTNTRYYFSDSETNEKPTVTLTMVDGELSFGNTHVTETAVQGDEFRGYQIGDGNNNKVGVHPDILFEYTEDEILIEGVEEAGLRRAMEFLKEKKKK